MSPFSTPGIFPLPIMCVVSYLGTRSPGRLEGKEAHPGLDQPFDEAMVCWLLGTSVRKTRRFLRTDAPSSQHSLVCPPGGFPGGSHLLAASRPGPTLPQPPGKPTADSCWPSTKRMVHVSRNAGTHVVLGDGKPPRFSLECRWRACTNPTRDPACRLFPVLCPGAPHCWTALLCSACGVPMRPAAHRGPSASLPCTC